MKKLAKENIYKLLEKTMDYFEKGRFKFISIFLFRIWQKIQ